MEMGALISKGKVCWNTVALEDNQTGRLLEIG